MAGQIFPVALTSRPAATLLTQLMTKSHQSDQVLFIQVGVSAPVHSKVLSWVNTLSVQLEGVPVHLECTAAETEPLHR